MTDQHEPDCSARGSAQSCPHTARTFWLVARLATRVVCEGLYISMDLTRQALQTNVKFFFQISESFSELVTIFQNKSGIGFIQAMWGGICSEQHSF